LFSLETALPNRLRLPGTGTVDASTTNPSLDYVSGATLNTATTDVPQVLDKLGIDYTTRGSEGNSYCPAHKRLKGREDNNPSWWINLDSGQHICFSCGYKGGLPILVCDVKHLFTKDGAPDFTAAKKWLADFTDVTVETLVEQVSKLPSYIYDLPQFVPMSEARLALFTDVPDKILETRNLTRESATHYGILWDPQNERWILPLREPDTGKLMGWQAKGLDRYFRNFPAGLAKSKTLFGVGVQQKDVAIVVESPLDCLRLHSAGIAGGVALCGALASPEQLKLLRASSKIIVAMDNPKIDDAGRKMSEQFRKLGLQYGLNLFFFRYGDTEAKDVGEMSDNQIVDGIRHAVSMVYGPTSYMQ
jgi:hypothetical protein